LSLAVAVSGCSLTVELNSPAGDSTDKVWTEPFDGYDLVDLSHPLSPDSLYWPNGSAFEYERQVWGTGDDGKWYAMGYFATPEHLGTHLDAPIHFAEGGWANTEIPVDRFFAPAVVVDISERATSDPNATLRASDIDEWVAGHGAIPDSAIILVRTGWSTKWPDWNAYYGSDDPFDTTTLNFPGVSAEGASRESRRAQSALGLIPQVSTRATTPLLTPIAFWPRPRSSISRT